MRAALLLAVCLSAACLDAGPAVEVQEAGPPAAPQGAHLRVLFLGDRGHHRPAERLQQVYGMLAQRGVAVDYEEDLDAVTPARLAHYDAVAVYANFPGHPALPPAFAGALRRFVADWGRGLVALHCASACFPQSPEWTRLVGARFAAHGTGTFRTRVVAPEHAVVAGWEPFESWDETYVHAGHRAEGRTVLTRRDAEPWTWVRTEGAGRVFYTAWGHDHRTWAQPGFQELLVRGLRWAAGPEAAARHDGFALPPLTYEPRDTVPNYEERDPPPQYQRPLAPEETARHLQTAAGLRVQLFAAEPDVVDPIAFCFGPRGRLWVAESVDYPNAVEKDGRGRDRITICEDVDGDGRADEFRVFAAGLNVPTGLVAAPGGVIVAQAPDLIFLHDDDGDDRADRRTVLASGFGRSDTHAGPSNLTWGPDGRLWGTVGYAGYRGPGSGGGTVRFAQGIWRCERDGSGMEFVAQFSNNTWGLGLRADGEIFGGTANGAPSFFVGVPRPLLAAVEPGHPGAAPVDDAEVLHPVTRLRQVDFHGDYTSAAGHRFLESPLFPPHLRGRALVCEPTGHLVALLEIVPDGSGYRARDDWNLIAGSDEWFAPVQAEVGPDGAVWIADFADYLVQHNPTPTEEWGGFDAETGEGNAHVNPLRDDAHGRIWRVLPADADPAVHVAPAPPPAPPADPVAALGDADPAVRKRALAALPGEPRSARALVASGALQDPDLAVRRHAFLAAARLPAEDALGAALGAVASQREVLADDWLPLALRAAGAAHPLGFLQAAGPAARREEAAATDEPGPNLVRNPGFEAADEEDPERPAAWRPRSYRGEAEYLWGTEGSGRGGGRAVAVRSEAGADGSWSTTVRVEPDVRYQLSGWIRGEDLQPVGDALGALFNLHARGQSVTGAVKEDGDGGWQRVELEFTTRPGERRVSLNALFGGWGVSTGTAWYDDVELRALGSVRGVAPSVAAVARVLGRRGAPAEVERYLAAVESGRAAASVAMIEALAAGYAAREEPEAEIARRIEALAGADLDAIAAREESQPLTEGGDPAAGARVFREHAVAACSACHAIGGEGGAVGPPLDGVGARLSRAEILRAVVEPDAEIAEGWPAETSAMPALRPFLSDQELRDLVAFLDAQR